MFQIRETALSSPALLALRICVRGLATLRAVGRVDSEHDFAVHEGTLRGGWETALSSRLVIVSQNGADLVYRIAVWVAFHRVRISRVLHARARYAINVHLDSSSEQVDYSRNAEIIYAGPLRRHDFSRASYLLRRVFGLKTCDYQYLEYPASRGSWGIISATKVAQYREGELQLSLSLEDV